MAVLRMLAFRVKSKPERTMAAQTARQSPQVMMDWFSLVAWFCLISVRLMAAMLAMIATQRQAAPVSAIAILPNHRPCAKLTGGRPSAFHPRCASIRGFFMGDLTPKQEKFAQCVADGMSQADAYRAAFNVASTTKPESVQQLASRLMADIKVSSRVDELREKLAERALWTREDSVNVLKSIATDEFNAKPAERVSAVKELNAMHGWNNKQVIDHTSSDGSMRPSPTRIELVAPSVKHDDDAD